ncbi:MAG TPA: transporter substrate-binding domain-containing protein [Thermodesulfobacteriaceae bacterium]|nr:transporter substrate-binding domain-containing protein [Thermodesulfobacteriaceae bacterium]
MRKGITAVITLMVFLFTGICFAGDTVKIGVLAKRGPERALKKWKATGDYLTTRLEGKKVDIIPLGFDKVFPAIEKGDVDFFLVNSSMFVTAEIKYGAKPVLTMINSRQGQALKSFGGVIFTNASNAAVNSLEDIKGKKFMAVKKSCFGGWQMALKEFVDAGMDPAKDFASVVYGGKHDNVVLAVKNGTVDVGTVRTDTLERMAAAGTIKMEEFKIIHKQEHRDFPFVCSTRLYPEWPLAKVAKTPDSLVHEVAAALKQIKPEDPAAKTAKIVGWTDPLDYSPVEELQKELRIGAYAH